MQTDASQAILHAHLRSPVGLNQVDKYLTASGFRHPDWHSHMAGGWNEMVCKIPSKSSHPMAVILLFACFTPTYKMLKAHGVLPPACISAGIGDNPVSQDLSGLPFPKPSHHTSVTVLGSLSLSLLITARNYSFNIPGFPPARARCKEQNHLLRSSCEPKQQK